MIGCLLWVVFVVLLVLWLIGFAVNWGAFIWVLRRKEIANPMGNQSSITNH